MGVLKELFEKPIDSSKVTGDILIKDLIQNHRPGKPPQDHDQSTHGRRVSRKDAKVSFRTSKRTGGVTYQPLTDNSPKKGMSVSIFPQHSEIIDPAELTEDRIFEYLKKHRTKFRNKKVHFGGWHDKEANLYYLDLSVVVDSHDEATRLSHLHDQEGYYDLKEKKEHIVKKKEDRRLAKNCRWDSETERDFRQGVKRVCKGSLQKDEGDVGCRFA